MSFKHLVFSKVQKAEIIPKKEQLGLAKSEKDALVTIQKANEFLIQTEVIEDIIKVKDFASVAQAVARVEHYEEAESSAIKLKLKAERKAGSVLSETPKLSGSRGIGKKVESQVVSPLPTLKQLGVTASESSRWQKIASVPEERFTKLLEDSTKASQNAILEVAKEFEKEMTPIEETPIPPQLKVEIYNCDFAKLDLKNDSIDFILTDPPWSLKEHRSEWEKLGPFALKVLKPSSRMITYTGRVFFRDSLNIISESLDYIWLICIVLKGNRKVYRDYFEEWRPAIVFGKPPYKQKEYCTDLLDNDAPEKQYHHWGQGVSAAEQIIRFHSKPNDLLFEPFAGGGSFIEAAINQKRNVIACERDKEQYKILKKRFPEACQD